MNESSAYALLAYALIGIVGLIVWLIIRSNKRARISEQASQIATKILSGKREMSEAELLYEAAVQGDVNAMATLGWMIRGQGNDTDGIAWLQYAADRGHVNAAASLGAFYMSVGNDALGYQYLDKAANGGNADAMFNLGVLPQMRRLSRGRSDGWNWQQPMAMLRPAQC